MPGKIERSVDELYHDDGERADALAFGRRTGLDRQGFLRGAGLAAMGAAVGGIIPFADRMPAGLIPAALAQSPPRRPKDRSISIFPARTTSSSCSASDRWWQNAEHLLDDDTTPIEKFFIRNNGMVPEAPKDPDTWKIVVDGEVNQKLELTLGELKAKFGR